MSILLALSAFFSFFRELRSMFRKPEYRSLLIWVILLLAVGTIFFSQVEGWNILDSLYYSVVTLTTVGYGDFSPATSLGKLFAMIYMFSGLSIVAAFVSMLAKERVQRHESQDGKTENEDE